MAKKKIDASNIIKLSGATTVLSLAVGASSSYLLAAMYPRHEISTIGCMIISWTIPHSYILIAGIDSLREELGIKSPIQISGNWGSRSLGRKIPIRSGDKESNIFMKALPFTSIIETENEDPPELQTVSMQYDDNWHTVTIPELEEFLHVAWRRQSQNKAPFSREYWTKVRRPRKKTLQYNILMTILCAIPNLVIDREERRSGRMSIEPRMALELIQNTL